MVFVIQITVNEHKLQRNNIAAGIKLGQYAINTGATRDSPIKLHTLKSAKIWNKLH